MTSVYLDHLQMLLQKEVTFPGAGGQDCNVLGGCISTNENSFSPVHYSRLGGSDLIYSRAVAAHAEIFE